MMKNDKYRLVCPGCGKIFFKSKSTSDAEAECSKCKIYCFISVSEDEIIYKLKSANHEKKICMV